MTSAEAKKTLKDLGFIPGTHKTKGMDAAKRASIKAATHALKRSGELYSYAEELQAKASKAAKSGK